MNIDVECYAGYKGGERPVRFRFGDTWIAVQEVVDRWYDPDASFFKVLTEGGEIYILRHDEREDTWTLVSYRRA
jgi:hypothetical protein